MTRQTTPRHYQTVSAVIAAGLLKSGFYLLETPLRETEKAVAFAAVGGNAYGYPCRKTAWLPKSQVVKLANDFYTNRAPAEMWLVPAWLIAAKRAEGLDVLATL